MNNLREKMKLINNVSFKDDETIKIYDTHLPAGMLRAFCIDNLKEGESVILTMSSDRLVTMRRKG